MKIISLNQSVLLIIIAIIVTTAFSRCKKDDHEIVQQLPEKSKYYEMSGNTKRPEKLQNFNNTKITQDQLVLSFNSTSNLPTYKAGDILVGNEGTGYIRKVKSASTQGNSITLITEDASIDEAYDKALVDTTFDMVFPSDSKNYLGLNGAIQTTNQSENKSYNVTATSSSYSLSNDGKVFTKNIINYSLIIEDNISGGKITLSIDTIRLQLSAKIKELNWEYNFGLKKFKWVNEMSPIIRFKNISLIYSGVISKTDSIKFFAQPIRLGVIPTVIPGVIITPEFNLFAGLKSSLTLSGGVKSKNTVTLNSIINVGCEIVGGQIQSIWSSSPTGTNEMTLEPTGSIAGEVKVFLKATIDARISGTLGLGVFVKPYEYNKLSFPPFSGEMGIGIGGGISANMKLFSKYLFSYDVTLVDIRKPFFSRSSPVFDNSQTPKSNSVNISLNPTLIWNCNDSDGDQLKYDVYFGTLENPPLVVSNITLKSYTPTELVPNKKYYWKIVAKDVDGFIIPTNIWNFTTGQNILIPTVVTPTVSIFTSNSATVGGNVTSDGGATVTERGVYWGTSQNPETTGTKLQIGNGSGSFSTTLPGLSPNTPYYVKAYAINSKGTAYGSQVSFTTLSSVESGIIFNPNLKYGSINDVEGNTYKTIIIGTQTWMAENLKTTRYNDGQKIPRLKDGKAEMYCWYNNDSVTNKPTYGALYNWYTINTGKLCPSGWHVPSDAEWNLMESYLATNIGDKLKETGNSHWTESSVNASNTSGFTGLPGGELNGSGIFQTQGTAGIWHTSTEVETNLGDNYRRTLLYNTSTIDHYQTYKSCGYSVRCVKN